MAFNHFDKQGRAHMVDVSTKTETAREAVAEAGVDLGPGLLAEILDQGLAKGDVLGVARLAGIAAVKRTPDLIPLAHPLPVHYAAVDFTPEPETGRLRIRCTVRTVGRTGVEMEAMTGAGVAALTVYDMVKGRRKAVAVSDLYLVRKTGGKSGPWEREGSA